MIADLVFDPPRAAGRARPARYVRRPSIPLTVACLVANGIRETLRELLGESCEVTIGEPAAIGADAWTALTRDAHCFLTRGRQTDVVLVLPHRDARALVRHAFGEGGAGGDDACSALELHAVERIASRCAVVFDALCAERRGPSRPVRAGELPTCVAYFDVRIGAPIALTMGLGIARDLPDPGPSGSIGVGALARVPLEVHAIFARGTLDARTFVSLRPGDLVRLDTKVGSPAALNVGDQRIAGGACGVISARTAFRVHETYVLGATP